jgi:hypothetical protein
MQAAVTYLRKIFGNFSTGTDDIHKKKISEQLKSRLKFNPGIFRTQVVIAVV